MKRNFIVIFLIFSIIFSSISIVSAEQGQNSDDPIMASLSATWEGNGRVRYRMVVENNGGSNIEGTELKFTTPNNGKILEVSRVENVSIGKSQGMTKLIWNIPLLTTDDVEILECVLDTNAARPENVKPCKLIVNWNQRLKGQGELTINDVAVGDFEGGSCTAVDLYKHTEGYPPYPSKGKDLGVLRGSWYEMGCQYGERVGEPIKWYFDHRFSGHVEKYGLQHVIDDVHRYEAEAKKFFPEALDFIRGIADGATEYLSKSTYNNDLSHYEKILFLNCDNCLFYGHPGEEAHGNNAATAIPEEKHEYEACSAIALLGSKGATKNGKTIIAQNNDGDFDREMYRLTYIAIPSDPKANSFWATTAPGKIFEIMGENSKGLSVAVLAGGWRTYVPEEGINERAFGVTWQYVLLKQMAYADNCQEALELVTHGTPEYRALTGRKTLLRTRHNNWIIADTKEACVVESTANRYAVRYPGDYGEEPGYIVVSNHYVCDYSYDENDVRTDYPMTTFGDENFIPDSTTRYYTLWWLAKNNYGSIDTNMVKEFMSTHYFINKKGERIDYVWDKENGWIPAHLGTYTVCGHSGYPENYAGVTVDPKVAVLDDRIMHFVVGRPCEWQGMWRIFSIPEK